ncbi:uncharacterized protein LOC133815841 [Humulus lupulus]|uniref:uncharacterized protein LOC133815841 n=1 Tax=Humulus lupulus TaxID=3486 RepID=UPI002B413034|nr:uncharacterized protein LOC133815841 [Humulus lupulus]
MTIDKSWMSVKDRSSDEYVGGVKAFVERAKTYMNEQGQIRCPCAVCLNRNLHDSSTVEHHLIEKGIQHTYTIWAYHGESYPPQECESEDSMDEEESETERVKLADVLGEASEGLTLSDKLMHLKAFHQLSNESFDALVKLLKEVFPEGTVLPEPQCETESKAQSMQKKRKNNKKK